MPETVKGPRPVDINTLFAGNSAMLTLLFSVQGIYDRFEAGELNAQQTSEALTLAGLTDELEEPDPELGDQSVLSIFIDNRKIGNRVAEPKPSEELSEEAA